MPIAFAGDAVLEGIDGVEGDGLSWLDCSDWFDIAAEGVVETPLLMDLLHVRPHVFRGV